MRRLFVATLVTLSIFGGAGLSPNTIAPDLAPATALAADLVVNSCDATSFNDALADVQADGGGTLTLDCSGTILFAAEQVITTDVTIIGNGAVTFDGGESTRLFTIDGGARLVLDDLTLENGRSNLGGAIFNTGTLELVDSIFSNNAALGPALQTFGGAIYSDDGATLEIQGGAFTGNSSDGSGGAIFNSASTTTEIFDSAFNLNTTAEFGGAIFSGGDSLLAITGSTFVENSTSGFGGAVTNIDSSLTITDSTFDNNTADQAGGAVSSVAAPNAAATLNIYDSNFLNNGADLAGAVLNDAGSTAGIFASMFEGNVAFLDGGAVTNRSELTVIASTFTANEATNFSGGAIDNDEGVLDVRASTFRNNMAASNGGAVFSRDALTVTASTFETNDASGGGAIWVSGGETVEITSSTFRANHANFLGGAFYNQGSTASIGASTFYLNEAEANGSTIYTGDELEIHSSIIAAAGGDELPHCSTGFVTIASDGSNLADDLSCNLTQSTDQQALDVTIDLNALADNGGPTETFLPMPTSDAIDEAVCSASSAQDQRGVTRPATGCDVGSVEVEGMVLARVVALYSLSGIAVDEGQITNFEAVAYGPDNADLAYSFDCDNDSVYETPGSGSGTTGSGACTFPDNGLSTVGVEVCAGGDLGNCGSLTTEITVNNVPPNIDSITTNDPAPQGQPATITVYASDPGIDDILSYRFDCDGDGSYDIGPQPANVADCPLDPAAATTTIPVEVSDDDGGVATDSVTVGQTTAICGSFYTGELSALPAAGCPSGSSELTLPATTPTTLCINPYTGALIWSPQGACTGSSWPHIVPDDGPLNYCASVWTGKVRYSAKGQCNSSETPGVIPG